MLQEAEHHAKARNHEKVIHRNRRIMPVQLVCMAEVTVFQEFHMAQDNQENHDATKAL
ncbi:hypothetical protein [Mitsuokella multacida]|uniref:hypothetical protein n=1 Tax=Mitsuokella multacida TaxID=52226 RepID=UPI0022E87D58|nr:hypothetical protein [Mitsuokella multacida]